MTTSTLNANHEHRRPAASPNLVTVLGVAATLGAVAALCEDATLQFVLWAFLR